jgi:MGT family glycosyltransferase
VYASLGTLQNRREPLFRCFAEACRGLNVQLVIAHGGGLSESEARDLPGDPLVVEYAPQVELLARARVTITHGGLNTVLDSLANGVPLVTIPLTYEQPAIARRIEWAGAGRSLSWKTLSTSRLRGALQIVLDDPQYAAGAKRMQDSIVLCGGVNRAADTVESVCDV